MFQMNFSIVMILTDNVCHIISICTHRWCTVINVTCCNCVNFFVVIPGAVETRYNRHSSTASGNLV